MAAAVHIKSDERKAHEERVMRSFGVDPANREQREAAEVIAARSNEAYNDLRRMEGNRR